MKPFDFWNQGTKIITDAKSVNTKTNKDLKMKYDDSSKEHLTKKILNPDK
jgi:hypothetical protein